MTDLMNQLINHKAVYRTAPATPGLLNISIHFFPLLCFLFLFIDKFSDIVHT